MSSRKSITLRLDSNLHSELKAWAQQEMRSMNHQIEYLLVNALRQREHGARPLKQDLDDGKQSNE